MTEPIDAMQKLDALATELDTRSNQLAEVTRELDPLQGEYDDFIAAYETGLWDEHENDGAKLPSESMRLLLARREMPAQIRGKHRELVDRRERLKRRIGDLKVQVEAQRSILSALKVEAEATGGGLRSAA